MATNDNSIPGTFEAIVGGHKGRRYGMLRALTTECRKFHELCDPDSENLCLYSFPNGSWKVSKPADEIPSELPEPCLGINFSRDSMSQKDWLSLVSAHSDSWLFAVTFFYAATLDKEERAKLFDVINELPTLYEVVTRQDYTSYMQAPVRQVDVANDNTDEKDEDEEEETYCGACRGSYSTSKSKFWILCDSCKSWFHGKCVKMTLATAEKIESYKCPVCAKKRPHP